MFTNSSVFLLFFFFFNNKLNSTTHAKTGRIIIVSLVFIPRSIMITPSNPVISVNKIPLTLFIISQWSDLYFIVALVCFIIVHFLLLYFLIHVYAFLFVDMSIHQVCRCVVFAVFTSPAC